MREVKRIALPTTGTILEEDVAFEMTRLELCLTMLCFALVIDIVIEYECILNCESLTM